VTNVDKSSFRVCLLSALLACATLASPSHAVELRMSVFLPPKHPIVAGGLSGFVERVAKDTNGELTFKLFTTGSLLSAKTSPEGIRDRVADAGFMIAHYSPGQFPHAAFLSDLSMLNEDPYVAAAAMSELVLLDCAGCLKEYRDMGLVYTGTYSSSTYYPISIRSNRRTSDFAGVKMRTGGNVWDRWAKHVGGVAVNLPVDEVFEAMSRGMVDTVFLNPSAIKSYSLSNVAKTVTLLPLGAFGNASTVTFNSKVWQRLSAEQKRIVLRNVARANLSIASTYLKSDADAIKNAAGQGIRIEEPAAELKDDLKRFVEADLAELAAANSGKIPNAAALIERYRSLQAKYKKLFEPAKGDLDSMTKILTSELYDKVDVSRYGL
jgi:TRAP-type C4-dicarboxylate transport system substrate-binding protein